MNIQNSKALVPVQTTMKLYADHEHKGLDRFHKQNRPEDEMVFIGYGPGNNHNTYGSHGKMRGNSMSPGELVDIYV